MPNKGELPQAESNLSRSLKKGHFCELVKKHGGKWIVLTEGKLIGIGSSADIPALMEKARAAAPSAIPFLAPIPTPEDLECVL